jgi:(1->4)-alpha-D-glucan 1-alpha-D-glucosylmutase
MPPIDSKNSHRVPSATYRVQFNRFFTFKQATELIGYLNALGITDYYASPVLAARSGSLHGYDIVDHGTLNPELGTKEDFVALSDSLREHGMGLIMDVVPNHICVAGSTNEWWNDILENGPGSPFAGFLDIDWTPPKKDLDNKVLLPVLGDQYGRVLEQQEIQLSYQRGAFSVSYYDLKLPIAPRTSIAILNALLESLPAPTEETRADTLELESIITALKNLPPRTETDPERVKERRREKEIIGKRLRALVNASPQIKSALKQVVRTFNGKKGVPESFDRLEELLAEQAYRLCYWRVAADEINYRRFFDVNELAAIRVENPAVFTAVHRLILGLIGEGRVTGLRIDHVDGLYDPEEYLRNLQRACMDALQKSKAAPAQAAQEANCNAGNACYVVVEKILGRGAQLRTSWPTCGTTGYDFLNLVNGLFVDSQNESAFHKLYQRFTGLQQTFSETAYRSKKLILRAAMSGELFVLARKLDKISEQHRYTRDFTLNSLQYALGELIACFPVYRSYIRPDDSSVNEEDARYIRSAVRSAMSRNPAVSPSIFDFIASLLMLRDPEGLTDEERAERREFVLRFQQLTGPVTAKGVEDTAFYRFYPLASLCEVGGDPSLFGISTREFHHECELRLSRTPHTMLATSTHDTKRSEDVRARINVLSELPTRWYRAVRHWQNLTRDQKKSVDGSPAPDSNEEYLLYQTLIGAWPSMNSDSTESFVHRIQEYLRKAIREAKIHSSWLSPNEEYEQAVSDFVRDILSPDHPFAAELNRFQNSISRAGVFNSISQTLLKITAPGVPDFYQGAEIQDFSLVDPDNRRPVDYDTRRSMLASLQRDQNAVKLTEELLATEQNDVLKLFVTMRALNLRRNLRELFHSGEYIALQTSGERGRHVVAFARRLDKKIVVVIATRFFTALENGTRLPIGKEVWKDTRAVMKKEFAGCYREAFTERTVCATPMHDQSSFSIAETCAHLPVALLERISE